MEIHRFNNLANIISKPYKLTDSKPPHSFNCWSLITYLYPDAPDFKPDKIKEYVKLFNENKDTLAWIEVSEPKYGDIILMAKNDYYSHAGVYLDKKRIIHAKHNVGVVIEPINMVKLSFKNIKVYRWL